MKKPKRLLQPTLRRNKLKSSKSKTHLYIDGTNLFAGQNELFGPKKYLPFSVLMQHINKLFPVDRVFFYATYIGQLACKKPKLKKMLGSEAKFYREARAFPRTQFFKGHRSPTSGKEKGVDVHLAVDMVKDAFLQNCSQAVIISGDADLIYPIEIVKMLHIPVHAVFLSNRFSLEMAHRVDSAIVLNFKRRFKIKSKKLPNKLKIVEIKSPACKHAG